MRSFLPVSRSIVRTRYRVKVAEEQGGTDEGLCYDGDGIY